MQYNLGRHGWLTRLYLRSGRVFGLERVLAKMMKHKD
jgi:hypothetical protein